MSIIICVSPRAARARARSTLDTPRSLYSESDRRGPRILGTHTRERRTGLTFLYKHFTHFYRKQYTIEYVELCSFLWSSEVCCGSRLVWGSTNTERLQVERLQVERPHRTKKAGW